MTPKKQVAKPDAPRPTTSTPTAPQPQAPAATPKAQEVAPMAAATPNKQRQTIDKLKAAWLERKIDIAKLTETQDGKFINVVVGEGWPVIAIGPTGGITLPQVRSYARAFDAAVDGLAIFQKQLARDAKKATTSATAAKPATAPAPAAKETPTVRKQKQGAAVEAQLQSATA